MEAQVAYVLLIVVSFLLIAISTVLLFSTRASRRREQHMADQLLKLGDELLGLREFKAKIMSELGPTWSDSPHVKNQEETEHDLMDRLAVKAMRSWLKDNPY